MKSTSALKFNTASSCHHTYEKTQFDSQTTWNFLEDTFDICPL